MAVDGERMGVLREFAVFSLRSKKRSGRKEVVEGNVVGSCSLL
jgi:hypothetical protein